MRDVLEIVLVVVLEARAMLQKNMCHLRMAVAGKSTADRSPNFEEYHRVLHCKNSIHITFQNPATKSP